jgi:hypothetical protein
MNAKHTKNDSHQLKAIAGELDAEVYEILVHGEQTSPLDLETAPSERVGRSYEGERAQPV